MLRGFAALGRVDSLDDATGAVRNPSGMATPAVTLPHDRELDEPQRVLLWRISRLVRAGYDEEAAVTLARSSVDLHTAVELVEDGCPSELALRILE